MASPTPPTTFVSQAFRGQRLAKRSLKNEASGLEASGALLGAKWAPGAFPGGCQKAPEALWGRKKTHCHLPGALRRNFPARFHPPRGARGPLWAPFWEALGLILALLLAIGVENAKISNFANSPHENLDFQGSGGLPGSIFGAKNRYRKDMEAKSAQKPAPRPSKSLPERSWRASGAKKTELWELPKAPLKGFSNDIGKKLPSAGTRSAVLAEP